MPFLRALPLLLLASTVHAQTTVSGGTIINQTWTPAGSPYDIRGVNPAPTTVRGLTVQAGAQANNHHTLSIEDTFTLTNNGTIHNYTTLLNLGVFTNEEQGTAVRYNAFTNHPGATFWNQGQFTNAGGTLINWGRIQIDGADSAFTNAGTIENHALIQGTNHGKLVNTPGNTVIVQGAGVLDVEVGNQGNLIFIADTQAMAFGQTVDQGGNATLGALYKQGTHALTLTGQQAYYGVSVVDGALLVDGDLTAASLGFATTTLGGSGTITLRQANSWGGTLSPGSAPTGPTGHVGHLRIDTSNAVTLQGPLLADVGATSNDRLKLASGATGAFHLDNSFRVTVRDADPTGSSGNKLAAGSYTLVEGVASFQAGAMTDPVMPSGWLGTLRFALGGNDLVLDVTPDAQCGSQTPAYAMPSDAAKCSIGTPKLTGAGSWNGYNNSFFVGQCVGSNGGIASCAVPRIWRITAQAVGGGGAIALDTTSGVADIITNDSSDNKTRRFTLTPDSGYVVGTIASDCPGQTLVGNTLTVGPLTQSCFINAPFQLFAPVPAATPVPTLSGWALTLLTVLILLLGGRRWTQADT